MIIIYNNRLSMPVAKMGLVGNFSVPVSVLLLPV